MIGHSRDKARPASTPACAAAYVRMSTMQQDQSAAQQLERIRHHAAATQCTLVKVYQDDGRSGLGTRGRHALLQMLADIGAGSPGYDRVLVYDVSRWGRFQDVDESAYYEYWCRRHGIAVVYCAEQFANDSMPVSHIMKTIKRTMAAEYSRALSERTFEAHAFFLAQGFKQGGSPGYGLRRLCLRSDGSVRRELADGERKAHPSDRVVLAPGPEQELGTVRHIFQLYTEQRLGFRALARWLNAEGRTALHGMPWTEARVKAVLTNEKYCGNLLYNRSSCRMGSRRRLNKRDVWLRCDAAHTPIVSLEVFAAAQQQNRLRRGLDQEAVLVRLREIYARDGRLSGRLIDAEAGMPHTALIKRMFGSLDQAYALALGSVAARASCFQQAASCEAAAELRKALRVHCEAAGVTFAQTSQSAVVRICDVTTRVVAVRCRERGGSYGWVLPALAAETDFVIAALLDREGVVTAGYALISVAEFSAQHKWVTFKQKEISGLRLVANLDELLA